MMHEIDCHDARKDGFQCPVYNRRGCRALTRSTDIRCGFPPFISRGMRSMNLTGLEEHLDGAGTNLGMRIGSIDRYVKSWVQMRTQIFHARRDDAWFSR